MFEAVHKLLLDQLRALDRLDLDIAVAHRAFVRMGCPHAVISAGSLLG